MPQDHSAFQRISSAGEDSRRRGEGRWILFDPVFFLYVTIIALTPLPLGSFRPWSASLAEVLLGLCAVFWGGAVLRRPGTAGVSWRRLMVPTILYGMALAWGAFQRVPLAPVGWVHPDWSQAEAALGPLPGRVSMAPSTGYESLLQLVAGGVAFWLAVQMGRAPHRARRMVETLALVSGAIAFYGLIVYLSGAETIFWLEKWAYRGDLTATLVNRNHYATLAGLGLLCAVAAILGRWRREGGEGICA
ncbi:MAG: hypothetical protein ABT940_05440 [Alphaproteobacteria bacterium]